MEELVKQAKMGNDEAFTQLIIQMQCEMFRIAQTRLKNIDDANDAIQQTNLYAYKNLRQLKEDKYFKTWIIKILINNVNMKNRHYNKFQDEPVEDYIGEIEYSNIEENIDLYDAIDRLDEKYKTPVILQYFHDLTISQIAEIMECNENTVKSNIRRAKKKLYDILKEEK